MATIMATTFEQPNASLVDPSLAEHLDPEIERLRETVSRLADLLR